MGTKQRGHQPVCDVRTRIFLLRFIVRDYTTIQEDTKGTLAQEEPIRSIIPVLHQPQHHHPSTYKIPPMHKSQYPQYPSISKASRYLSKSHLNLSTPDAAGTFLGRPFHALSTLTPALKLSELSSSLPSSYMAPGRNPFHFANNKTALHLSYRQPSLP